LRKDFTGMILLGSPSQTKSLPEEDSGRA